MRTVFVVILICIAALIALRRDGVIASTALPIPVAPPLGETYYRFEGDGLENQEMLLTKTWQQAPAIAVETSVDPNLQLALKRTDTWLKKRRGHVDVDGVRISTKDQRKVVSALEQGIQNNKPIDLSQFDFYQLRGSDKRGNIQFTGYFSPILEARRQPDDVFRYPIYRKPPEWRRDTYLSRSQIDGDKQLSGRNLEIAWTKSLFDNFILHVQGSGYLEYEDGSHQFVAFGGKNGHPYVSIGKLLVQQGLLDSRSVSLDAMRRFFDANPDRLTEYLFQSPSYVFFYPTDHGPRGASGIEVVEGYSIAVDPRIVPYGSVLLAQVPIIDEKHRVTHHRWQLLFAHDTGAAINGPGHVDLYMGSGDKAKNLASGMHHYGKMWLLMPK